jgi:hypothetical protein
LLFYILVCILHINPIKNDKFCKKNQKNSGNIPKFSLFFLLYIWRYLWFTKN